MKTETFVYTGCENLEAMTEAKNYNRYLIGIIKKEINRLGKKNPSILDFGAGSGTYADMLKDEDIHTDCLEPDKKLQKTLAKKGYKVVNDAKDLKEQTYDIIYALNVMEHVKDDHDVVVQLTKALKIGGAIIIYVPAFQMLYSSMDKLVGHHRRYRKKRLRNIAKNNQLNIVSLRYADPIGFGAALVYKISGNKKGTISPNSVRLYDRFAFPISKLVEPLTKHAFGKNVVMVAQRRSR